MPLPVLWAESMLSGIVEEENYKSIPNNFTAMVEPVDYAKRVLSGKISLAEWLIDFKEMNCGFYYSADDIEPFKEVVKYWKELG